MKRHSLLFGVQDYPGTGSLEPLTAPGADVDALAEVVGDARYMGEVGKVRPYKDLRLADARQKFAEFFDGIDREDVVLIYFSGHGLRDVDAIGHLYLCFTDTDENKLDLTAQRVSEIGEWLDRRGFQRTLIVLDCCYSGAAGEQLTKGSLTAQLQAIEQPHADGTGRYVLSSSGRATASVEKKSLGRSVFTHHLIEGIRTGAADMDGNGTISVSEISAYLSDKVPKDAIGQLPELSSRKTSGTFIVAHNLRVIEEHKRQRDAEAAAERARERAALTGAVVARLREHVQFGSMDMDFAGSVQAWLDAHPTEAAGHPRLALLSEFSEGRLSAIKFHDRWRGADAPPGRAASAPPEPVTIHVHGVASGTTEPITTVPEARPTAAAPPKEAVIAPETPPPASGATAAVTRPAAPAGPDAAMHAAAGRLRWRAGLVGICYFGLLCGLELLGMYSTSFAVLPGAVAGALASRLSYPRRWLGCFTSLVAVVLAHGAFVAIVVFEGSVDDYLASLIDYPEAHIRHIGFGVGGFLIAWVLLGAFRRTFRRRRSGGAGA